MILSDLIGRPVHDGDGRRVGVVVDVRFALDGTRHQLLNAPRLHGLIVGSKSHSSFMGYERLDLRRPALLARWFRWRERGSFLVLWRDLASIGDDGVTLRTGAVRYSVRLGRREV